jgi:DNA invertase Pin-like site-specific DNA recombinase
MSKRPAFAYLRTSSAANVGADKDSDRRQRVAIHAYATQAGYEIVDEFYDQAVSGADPIDARPGFQRMLARIAGNGVQTILVENASRFARDLAVQLAGHDMLKREGIELIPVDAPDHFVNDTPTAVLVRQVLGAISEFDKASTVAKLRAARERKRLEQGKCEGRKSHAECRPEAVKLARKLRRQSPKTHRPMHSLRAIAGELAKAGHLNANEQPFSASSVKSMLER